MDNIENRIMNQFQPIPSGFYLPNETPPHLRWRCISNCLARRQSKQRMQSLLLHAGHLLVSAHQHAPSPRSTSHHMCCSAHFVWVAFTILCVLISFLLLCSHLANGMKKSASHASSTQSDVQSKSTGLNWIWIELNPIGLVNPSC